MFDFLKNLTKSNEEKQQEAFSAYLDGALSPSQRQAFEARLAGDADLRTELELAQLLRQQMSEMPRRVVPRIFTLDVSVYGVPRQEPLVQAYPFLRAATVMAAFFFVLALGLSVFTSQGGGELASVAQTAMEPAPALDAPMAEAEIAVEEEAVAEAPVEKAAEDMGLAAGVEAEAEAEEVAELAPLPTMTLALTETASMRTELGEEVTEETAMEAGDMAEAVASVEEAEGVLLPSAPAGAVGGEAATPTPMPTATISSLPRPDATETAVPRIVQPTTAPQDEIANAVEMDTAVDEAAPEQEGPQPTRSITTGQWLLIGLGLLLLLLVAVTLLARRRI